MKKSTLIILFACIAILAQAKVHVLDSVMRKDGLYVDNMKIYNDSAIFQGVNLKLDVFNTIYYLCSSNKQLQTYEMAVNVRLKQRFYPTLELGFAQGEIGPTDKLWKGTGGWASIGMDLNGLRKGLETQNALLIGVRVGTALQQYDLINIPMEDSYWRSRQTIDFYKQNRLDCWGEVVAGCQVQVYSGLMMGWYLRLKLLFTRKEDGTQPFPYYIPGYGYRDMSQWGINYYIGWKF